MRYTLFLLNLPLLLSHHPDDVSLVDPLHTCKGIVTVPPLSGARAVPVAEVGLVTVLHSLLAYPGALNRISLVLIVGDWVTLLPSAPRRL